MRVCLVAVICLVLAGCGTESGHQPNPASGATQSSQASGAYDASGFLTVERVEGPTPDRLDVGVVLEGTDDNGDVATALISGPTFGPGAHGYPRTIDLNMIIGNNQGPALTISAKYKVDAQPATPVPRGGCQGAKEIPTVIAPGVEEVGCLGYLIPRESGRLILSGNSNFDFYLPVARADN